MSEQYDVVVIGGGPGGYVCAVRAAQLGMKTALIDRRERLGGTCLNVGCIPSKALLTATKKFEEACEKFELMGIESDTPKINLKRMMAFKDTVIKDNARGIENLLKKNNVTVIRGEAEFKSRRTFSVKPLPKGHRYDVTGKHIVIATGSEPIIPHNVTVDEERIITNVGALSLKEVPKKMIVIGAGVIGLETAAVWQRLGTKITVIEYSDGILPAMDADIADALHTVLRNRGMNFKTGYDVTAVKAGKRGVKVTAVPVAGGEPETITADAVLISVGRRANTQGLKPEIPGIETDEFGRIAVDENFKTSVPGIYAIGDVIHGPMLAHKAEKEGMILAGLLAGHEGSVNYNHVPAVVYTNPEAASIGKTEQQLRREKITYKVGKFSFAANGRARAMGETEGFVKILADAATDAVLGCHIVGAEAGNMIHEVAMAMEMGAASGDIARTCHAHPTLNEAVKEAAMAIDIGISKGEHL